MSSHRQSARSPCLVWSQCSPPVLIRRSPPPRRNLQSRRRRRAGARSRWQNLPHARSAADHRTCRPKSCPSAAKGPNAVFDQPGLEDEIRKKLQKPDGAITIADLGKLHSLNLSASQKRTARLDTCTLSHLTGRRKTLFLAPGEYDDLSPLAELKNLESLSAAHSQVKDTAPLAKLKKLDRLDLAHTQSRPICFLATLTNLTELTLDDTQITDVAPLAQAHRLEKLGIQHTQVKDAAPLKALKKLKTLYVAGHAGGRRRWCRSPACAAMAPR